MTAIFKIFQQLGRPILEKNIGTYIQNCLPEIFEISPFQIFLLIFMQMNFRSFGIHEESVINIKTSKHQSISFKLKKILWKN